MQVVKPTCVVAILLVFVSLNGQAQTDLNEVHVMPRGESVQPDAADHFERAATGIIRKAVELVLVPVTVMDEANRVVTGLGQDNFHLYEDKQPQTIKNFWKEDEPVSIGILLDVSGSMKDKFDRAQDSVKALLQDSNPRDEFFLVTFADQPMILRDFTQNTDEIQSSLLFSAPKGRTSLLDAVILAVNNMKKAQYQRRALVIISDGGDNRSRHTEKDVKSLIKEANVMVYSIAVCDREVSTLEEQLGPELLAEISGVTGASAYLLDNPGILPKATEHIAVELRNQYFLAYSPSNSRSDGKWRKIKISLALPRGTPALHVQARMGYYGRRSNQ
jgi:Ca-activated chloride channel homolog